MAGSKMVKKDFITSIVLIAFSVSVVVLSYRMDRLEHRGIDPFSAPGVVPGMIGGILLLLALILFVRSLRHGGYRIFAISSGHGDGQDQVRGAAGRVLLTLLISLVYAIGLLGRFDYSVTTGLYIFAFICLFEYRRGEPIVGQSRMIVLALVQAIIAAGLITLVFEKLFLVDLP